MEGKNAQRTRTEYWKVETDDSISVKPVKLSMKGYGGADELTSWLVECQASFTLRPLYYRGLSPVTYWIRGCVDPIAGVDDI
jgi:hypothetical protein